MIDYMHFDTYDYMTLVEKYDDEFAYGTFLDVFRRDISKEEMQEMIAEPPKEDGGREQHIEAACLAATVEELCKIYGLQFPKWIVDPNYILEEPYYGLGTFPEYENFLRETSLPAFKKRNIFLGDNVMSRA